MFQFKTNYADNTHLRLANSAQLSCDLGEEDDFDGKNNQIVYEVRNYIGLARSLESSVVYTQGGNVRSNYRIPYPSLPCFNELVY